MSKQPRRSYTRSPGKHPQPVSRASFRSGNLALPSILAAETNFARLPIFPVGWRGLAEEGVREHVFYTTDDEGTRQRHRLIVSGDRRRGNLTPFDGTVFHALEAHITQIQRQEDVLPRVIPFTVYRLGQLLGYNKLRGYERTPGSAYGKIKAAIRRIGATRFTSERSFWSKDTDDWVELDFSVYTSVVFRGERDNRGHYSEQCWVELHPLYHNNLVCQNVKYYDYEYLLLLSPLPARLYKLLSFKFYGVRRRNPTRRFYRVDYLNWCQTIPVRPQSGFAAAKRSLDAAHQHLIDTDTITEVRYGKPKKRDGRLTFNISYFVGERILREMRGQFGSAALGDGVVQSTVDQEVIPFSRPIVSLASSTGSVDDNETELASSGLVRLLEERGVASTQARTFVSEHPEDRIRRQIDHFDYMKSHQPGAIKNPGAWLNTAIKRNHKLPDGLRGAQEAREREEKREDRLLRWSEERGRRIEADLRDWDATPAEDRISGRLKMAASKWSPDFRELARELGKGVAVEQTRQKLLDDLPKTEEKRRAFLEAQHDVNPPDDFE